MAEWEKNLHSLILTLQMPPPSHVCENFLWTSNYQKKVWANGSIMWQKCEWGHHNYKFITILFYRWERRVENEAHREKRHPSLIVKVGRKALLKWPSSGVRTVYMFYPKCHVVWWHRNTTNLFTIHLVYLDQTKDTREGICTDDRLKKSGTLLG